jgi:ketosteroid isomerase-like protein
MSATTTRHGVVAGDIALASASWEIRGTGPDGDPVEVRGASADLLRRHGDGRWLLVVDRPFGGS